MNNSDTWLPTGITKNSTPRIFRRVCQHCDLRQEDGTLLFGYASTLDLLDEDLFQRSTRISGQDFMAF